MFTGADQRSVGWADILVPTDAAPDGVKVRIVCTHLDAFGGDETCYEQAKEVIAYAVAPATELSYAPFHEKAACIAVSGCFRLVEAEGFEPPTLCL